MIVRNELVSINIRMRGDEAVTFSRLVRWHAAARKSSGATSTLLGSFHSAQVAGYQPKRKSPSIKERGTKGYEKDTSQGF